MVDIDALKAVNDSAGHGAGDSLLRATAGAITTALRPYDVCARWGGDEFVFAFPGTPQAARDRIAAIRGELGRRWPGATVSAGLAERRHADSLESLLARADADLYADKARGGR